MSSSKRYGLEKPENYLGFYRAIFGVERDVARSLVSNGIELRLLSRRVPFFFWLATSPAVMVFAHRNEGGLQSGLSFYTEDANLADEYRELFGREWEIAKAPIDGRF